VPQLVGRAFLLRIVRFGRKSTSQKYKCRRRSAMVNTPIPTPPWLRLHTSQTSLPCSLMNNTTTTPNRTYEQSTSRGLLLRLMRSAAAARRFPTVSSCMSELPLYCQRNGRSVNFVSTSALQQKSYQVHLSPPITTPPSLNFLANAASHESGLYKMVY